ncbi:receptor expression-enhancing protein 1-like isoform X2 [Mobula hypostoma]|uniref:receptor expression-enhancing protein 1-like isoform X2 n=1 Tax=Mobula hypostoma TaxID=723540 RepID=UPI002FC3ACED
MVSWLLSRLVVLAFGTLYPAYASYKAIKTKNVKEYVRWMMYWIVFAIFTTVETFADIFISWFPFYYEIKVAFVVWLLSPYTKGASMIYRKFVHPTLSSKETEIDCYIIQAKERSYETMVNFGRKGLNMAATAAVSAAAKSQGALAGRLKSFSIQDLTTIPVDEPTHYRDPLYPEHERLARDPILVARGEYSERSLGTALKHQYAESDSQDEYQSDGEAERQRSSIRREQLTSKSLRRGQMTRKKGPGKVGMIKTVKSGSKKRMVKSGVDSL